MALYEFWLRRRLNRRKTYPSPLKFAQQKLSNYHGEVTPTTGLLLISAHIPDAFRKLQSVRKWDMGMHKNPENETSSTTRYQEEFPKHVVNK